MIKQFLKVFKSMNKSFKKDLNSIDRTLELIEQELKKNDIIIAKKLNIQSI